MHLPPHTTTKWVELPSAFAYRDRSAHHRTDHRLRRNSRADRIIHGAYRGEPRLRRVPDWVDERWIDVYTKMLAIQSLRPDAIASHWSAAVLLGLPVSASPSSLYHVTTPLGPRPVRISGVVGHRSQWLNVVLVHDVKVTSAAYALIHLARYVDLNAAVGLIDALIGTWRNGPFTSRATLETFVRDTPGFRGRSTLLEALPFARENVGSPKETELRLALIRAGLPEPIVQFPIELLDFRFPIHPDLAYPEHKIAIEYEGAHHLVDRSQWEADIRRYHALQRAGWTVIRVTGLTDLGPIVAELRGHLGIA